MQDLIGLCCPRVRTGKSSNPFTVNMNCQSSMPVLCAYVTADVKKCVWTYPQLVRNPKHTIAPSQHILYALHSVNALHYICFTFTLGYIHKHTRGVHAVTESQSHINTNRRLNSFRVYGYIEGAGKQRKVGQSSKFWLLWVSKNHSSRHWIYINLNKQPQFYKRQDAVQNIIKI